MTEAEAYGDLTPLSQQEFERFAALFDGAPASYREFLTTRGWGTLAGDNLALFQAPDAATDMGFLRDSPPYLVFGTDKAGYFFAFRPSSAEVYGFEPRDEEPEVIAPDFFSFMAMKVAEA